jgi:hypothetical protein
MQVYLLVFEGTVAQHFRSQFFLFSAPPGTLVFKARQFQQLFPMGENISKNNKNRKNIYHAKLVMFQTASGTAKSRSFAKIFSPTEKIEIVFTSKPGSKVKLTTEKIKAENLWSLSFSSRAPKVHLIQLIKYLFRTFFLHF